MRIEARLNEELQLAVIKGELRERFDRAPTNTGGGEHVEGFARYSDEYGKIVAGYTIERVGRPRVPMREACNGMLKTLSRAAPQEILGFTWHNTVLGVLVQKGHGEYTSMLQRLALNLVHRVRITSETEDGNVHHMLGCQRAGKNAPVVYEKYSFRLPSPPAR